MYKLYWNAGSAAMAPHAVLQEIGVARVFTPGAPTHEITGLVAEHFGVQADAS